MVQRETTDKAPRATHLFADFRVVRNQIDNLLNIVPQPVAKPRYLGLIPTDVVLDLILRKRAGVNSRLHRPNTFRSIRALKVSQSEVTASPLSKAVHRRSISRAH